MTTPKLHTTTALDISNYVSAQELDPRKKKALEAARARLATVLDEVPEFALAKLRLEKGLSQASLAEKIGSKQPYIARIERGEDDLKISTVVKLAAALGVPSSVVFETVESMRAARLPGLEL